MEYAVSPRGDEKYLTIAQALRVARERGDGAPVIRLRAGVYREKLVIDLPDVTIIGEGRDVTRIVYGDGAYMTDRLGARLGTFRTAAVRLHADGARLCGLTIENDAGDGRLAGQAVALHIAGDGCEVRHCALLAHQDTLLIAPDWGDAANAEACGRSAYLEGCLIRGNVDFIFGSYAAWFERCELCCVSRGEPVNAMIAAPNTPEGQRFGFVFSRCEVTGDCGTGTVYLGRPWRPCGRAAFIDCKLPECVAPVGWLDWASPFRPVWSGLCETVCPDTPLRHAKAGALNAEAAAEYTIEGVLGRSPTENTELYGGSNMDIRAFVNGYIDGYTDYKESWNYEDGCVLMGAICLYRATGEAKYRDFVLDYLSRRVTPEGAIPSFEAEQYNIDSINCGKALFFALDETGDERYRRAIDFHMQKLREHPRCECGSFWHKTIYPNQVWLDGLYMALPFYAEYEKRFGGMKSLADIVRQVTNVREHLYDGGKGLFRHAWDEARVQPWADKAMGLSPNYWLRSTGWLLMALADTLSFMDERLMCEYKTVEGVFREAVDGILRWRDKDTGLFLQVIDLPDAEGNYAETSGTAMVAYALMRGAELGALDADKYLPVGRDIFERLAKQKLRAGEDGREHLFDICKVAGLGPGEKRDGSVAYYLSEPRVCDDSKGVGPFMMAWAQYIKSGEAL